LKELKPKKAWAVMARHKNLIISSDIVVAGRKRKCYHDSSHVISKGDQCLEVREKMAKKGYCTKCAGKMIQNARIVLDDLHAIVAGS